jgi:hypothetical protein
MPDKPKISKEDMDKILNCQDQLQSSLEGLLKATKKFNEESLKLEKQSAGLPSTTRGSLHYNKLQKKKALNAANNIIDKIIKDYTVDLAAIDKNIGILKSQEIYEKRMKDLISYYKQNISHDQKEIIEEKSKRAIANRMSTFYNNKDQTSLTVKKYTSYIYWTIFFFALVALIRALFIMFGFNFGFLSGAVTAIKQTTDGILKNVRNKVKNPLSAPQIEQIKRGPNTIVRQSRAMGKQSGGFKNSSLQPWLTIVLIFFLMPFVIIPYVLKPLHPYILELTLPRINN